jgi:hypothetical protein
MAWWSHAELDTGLGQRYEEPDGQAIDIDWGSLTFTLGAADIDDFDISEVDPLAHASAPTEVKERLIDDAVSLQLQKLEELRKKFVAHGKASKLQPGLQVRESIAIPQSLDASEVIIAKQDEKNDEARTRRRVKKRRKEEGSNLVDRKEKKEKKRVRKIVQIDREQEEVTVFIPDDEDKAPAPNVATCTVSPFKVGMEQKKPALQPRVIPIATPARATAPVLSSTQASSNGISRSIGMSSTARPTWGGQPHCRRGQSCQFLAWGICQYYHPPEQMPHGGFDNNLVGSERRWNVWVNTSRG